MIGGVGVDEARVDGVGEDDVRARRVSARPAVGPGRIWIAVLVGVAGVIALLTQAPLLLRHLEAFRVERVEILGTRHLAPHEALAASGITRLSSIFDDPEVWRAALLRHPLVAAVEIERRLPATIVVRILEVEPVALVRTPELRAVDHEARVLPIDPTAAELDLPVIGVTTAVAADERVADSVAVSLVEAAVRLRRIAPELAERVSELAPAPGGDVRLWLRQPARTEVLLSRGFDPVRLEQLGLTVADLERRAELPMVRRIDVRYRDQIVVALSPSAKS